MPKFKKNLFFLLILLILVYGVFLRFNKIGEQSYWIDEGYTLNAVLSTLEKGYPLLDSNQTYNAAPLNTYLIAGAVKLGGFNPIATRSVAVLFGLGVIFLVYLIGKKFFNSLVGLGAAFLTTFSYWEIAWSRQARMYIQLQFFFLLSLYLFNSLLTKFSYKKLAWLILATIATILSHYFGWFLLVIYALNLLIILIYNHKKSLNTLWTKKQKLIFSLIALVFIAFLIKLGFDLNNQLARSDVFLGLNYQSFMLNYWPLIFIGAIIGMILAIQKEKQLRTSLLLISAYFIPYLIIIFSASTQHFRYLFFILPLLFIFSSYLLEQVADISKKRKLIVFPILILATILISMAITPRSFSFLPTAYYRLEPFTPQPDFKSAYESIKANGWSEDKVIVSPFTQLDKVYLGRSGYWLAISLAGRKLDKSKLTEREYYNNAITISSADQLAKIINAKQGYIITDDMALSNRLDKEIIDLIGQQRLIFSDEKEIGNRIWVFTF